MKKFVLLSGFLFASMAMNATEIGVTPNSDEDIIAKKAAIEHKTEIFNAQIIKIQIIQSKDLNQSIRLLNQLQTIVRKMEKRIK